MHDRPIPAFAALLALAAALLAGCTAGFTREFFVDPLRHPSGAGVARVYHAAPDDAWAALLRLATDLGPVDGSKVVSKSKAGGWIMTERKMGFVAAAHDVFYLDRLDGGRVRIEVVCRSPSDSGAAAEPARAADLQSRLGSILGAAE